MGEAFQRYPTQFAKKKLTFVRIWSCAILLSGDLFIQILTIRRDRLRFEASYS